MPTSGIRTRRLSEGVAVEASIIARLLRWRVLTLDASILLLPADATPGDGEVTTRRRERRSRRTAARGRISDAIKNIDQADQGLARARQRNQAAAPSGRTAQRAPVSMLS
jgi:hypothetical protein